MTRNDIVTTTLFLAVSLTAKPGRVAELRAATIALLGPSRVDEGCLQYDLHSDVENPRHFFLYEAWRDVAKWRQAYLETGHLRSFLERLPKSRSPGKSTSSSESEVHRKCAVHSAYAHGP